MGLLPRNILVLFKLLLLSDITEYNVRDISPLCKKSKESELDQGGEGEAAVINETDSLGFIGLPAFHPGWEVSTFYGCWRGRRRGVTGGSVTALEGEFGQERESIRSWIIVRWFLFHIRGIVTIASVVFNPCPVLSAH